MAADAIGVVIDGRHVDVPRGTTILQAAAAVGIEIPTLCYLPGRAPLSSCFVCVVKVTGREGRTDYRPACATPITEPVEVETDSAAVRELRRQAVELLLAYHVGDCFAPCQLACPLRCDIPTLLAHIRRQAWDEAVRLLRQQVGLPHFLAQVCSAPCEKACRRAQWDQGLAVRSLCHALVHWEAENALAQQQPAPARQPRKVLVIGAGPTGLAAAWHLALSGHEVVVREKVAVPTPEWLQSHVDDSARLQPSAEPAWMALREDLHTITASGVTIWWGRPLEPQESPEQLLAQWDAVLLACGAEAVRIAHAWGLALNGQLVAVDKSSWQTSTAGIFATGSAVHGKSSPLRCLTDAKLAALAVANFLSSGESSTGENPFIVRMGRLSREELAILVEGARVDLRQEIAVPPTGQPTDWTATLVQMEQEADRCLRCGCVAAAGCKLRQLAAQVGADPRRHAAQRPPLARVDRQAVVVYDPGKCVLCGRCLAVAHELGVSPGITFVGRGFDTRVGTPFGQSFVDALGPAAEACAAVCPTGALFCQGEELKPAAGTTAAKENPRNGLS